MVKKLNPEQKKAVKHEGGPLLIIAGAGTGKTTVITERIKYLIAKKNVEPSSILALTFTEKAAREMEERVDEAMPLGYSQIFIGTFHSFCDRVLREEALHIGLDPGFKLLTEMELVALMKKNLHDLSLSYFKPAGNPQKFLQGLIRHFSRLEDEMVKVSDYEAFVEKKFGKKKLSEEEKLDKEKWKELLTAYKMFKKLKIDEGVMDFADLIGNTIKLFEMRPNVLKEYRKRFVHVLVDEYQDTNIAQNKLVEMICPPKSKPNLFVVGDDSQSIYKFRGAAVSNILEFFKTYNGAKRVVLTKNYRSTQNILDAAHRLIKKNDPDTLEHKMGIDKSLISTRGEKGANLEFFFPPRVENETEMVVKKIRELKENDEELEWSDFAILVRANNHAEPFLTELSRMAVPYQFLGPAQLFRQKEIKELIAYLQLLVDPVDDVAAFRVLSSEEISIDQSELGLLGGYAKRQGLSYYEIIKKVLSWDYGQTEKLKFGQYSQRPPVLSEETKTKVENFVEMFEKHLELAKKESGGQILYNYLRDTNYLDLIIDPENEETARAAENIGLFFDKVKAFEANREEKRVRDLLDWIQMRLELGDSPLVSKNDWTKNEAVNVLTVHSGKGLEFRVVFVVNVVDQRFPTRRRSEQIPLPEELVKEILPEGDPHEQEERRLFYVAMTRAKDYLFLSGAKFYNEEAKREKKASIFVKEALGEDLITKSGKEKQISLLEWEGKEKTEEFTREKLSERRINYLSYSQMNNFSICPRQYKYQYILKLPSPPRAAQILGTSVHETLKSFYQQVKAKLIKGEKEELLRFLKKNWQSVGFDNKKHEKDTYKKAVEMLTKYYDESFDKKTVDKVLALEKRFSLKIGPELKIGGVVDRVDDIGEGMIEVIDYKTGGKVPSQREVDRDEQLSLYALAVSLDGSYYQKPVEKIKLTLWFLDEGKKVSTTRTKEEVEEMRKKVIETAEEISKSEFPAKPGKVFPCGFCAYKLVCDEWK